MGEETGNGREGDLYTRGAHGCGQSNVHISRTLWRRFFAITDVELKNGTSQKMKALPQMIRKTIGCSGRFMHASTFA